MNEFRKRGVVSEQRNESEIDWLTEFVSKQANKFMPIKQGRKEKRRKERKRSRALDHRNEIQKSKEKKHQGLNCGQP